MIFARKNFSWFFGVGTCPSAPVSYAYAFTVASGTAKGDMYPSRRWHIFQAPAKHTPYSTILRSLDTGLLSNNDKNSYRLNFCSRKHIGFILVSVKITFAATLKHNNGYIKCILKGSIILGAADPLNFYYGCNRTHWTRTGKSAPTIRRSTHHSTECHSLKYDKAGCNADISCQ